MEQSLFQAFSYELKVPNFKTELEAILAAILEHQIRTLKTLLVAKNVAMYRRWHLLMNSVR